MKNKKILLMLLALLLVTACGKVPTLTNGEEAVVSFEKSELSISVNDLFNELKDKYALEILVDMIDRKILESKYPDELETAKKYAKEQLTEVKGYYQDNNGNYDEDAFITALKSAYGFENIDEFEKLLYLSYLRSKAVEDYAKDQITDKQIKDYYKSDIVGDIEASHILIAVNATESMTEQEKKDAEAAAKKQAEGIIKELDGGANFAELAKKYSADKTTAEKGGSLGYFNKGDMGDNSFDTAAYELKLNTYSKKPVKSTFGYHIILKTGEKEKAALDEVKDKIVETLATALQSQDARLSIDALCDLRKAYGFNIEDSDLKKAYDKYVSALIVQAQAQSQTTE